jgi:hypothetical protein
MVFKEVLKWMPDCGYTERTVLVIAVLYTQLPRLESLPGSSIIEKKPPEGGFFVFRSKRLRAEKNDLKKILSSQDRYPWDL